ncbi:hypothetical protein ACFV9W_07220 [Streptomyces sp. NPDC059897]|uniref:hypothetical protein n=1 Tax=Streptomyces sp. NPDC059897 TaxID=3346994 RepID=UPI0036480A0D
MTAFYHVCFVVPDIERAMRDFRRSAGVEWSEPASDRLGEWDYGSCSPRAGRRSSS